MLTLFCTSLHPGVELLGHIITPYLIFYAKLFSKATAPFSFPPAVDEGFHFSTAWPTLVIVHRVYCSHPSVADRFLR